MHKKPRPPNWGSQPQLSSCATVTPGNAKLDPGTANWELGKWQVENAQNTDPSCVQLLHLELPTGDWAVYNVQPSLWIIMFIHRAT